LRLVTILGGQAHVDVLARAVSLPLRNVENDGLGSGRLFDVLNHCSDLPVQSPA
jgi:hypothetical protein